MYIGFAALYSIQSLRRRVITRNYETRHSDETVSVLVLYNAPFYAGMYGLFDPECYRFKIVLPTFLSHCFANLEPKRKDSNLSGKEHPPCEACVFCSSLQRITGPQALFSH